MNIKYNKKQQELRDDPVMDGLLKTKEFMNTNSKTVYTLLTVLVVLVGIGLGFNQYRQNRFKNAREDFGKAMIAYSEQNMELAINQFKMVAENYRGSASGAMGAYMLASVLFSQAKYDEAITWYETVIKGAKIDFITGQSYEGLASCYEAKGDNESALQQLKKAVSDTRIVFRHGAIRWKMALLLKEKDPSEAIKLCKEIVADTLAVQYVADARYLQGALAR